MSPPRPRVGVSACLLGERVRWDGGARRDAWLTDVLAAHVELAPVCPEVGAGMGVPREPVQLVAASPGAPPRLSGVTSGRDWTDALSSWTAAALAALEAQGPLAGFVLKASSPSCGMSVPVFGAPAVRGGAPGAPGAPRAALGPLGQAPGLFAAAVRARGLPAADEQALAERARRDDFLARVFTRARLLALAPGDDLPAFLAAHRDLLRALLGGGPPWRGLDALAAARDLPRLRERLGAALGGSALLPASWTRPLARRLRALRGVLSPGEQAVAHAALRALAQGRAAPDVARACLRRLTLAHGRPVDLLLAPYPPSLET